MIEDDDEAAMAAFLARHAADYQELRRATRGASVTEAERLVREFAATYSPRIDDISLALTARVMTEPRWARRHQIAVLALAWRYRRTRPMRRTLRWWWRPRFAG